jgi:hypothetical protein
MAHRLDLRTPGPSGSPRGSALSTSSHRAVGRPWGRIAASVPLLFLAGVALMKVVAPTTYVELFTREDSVVEYGTVLVYLVTAAVGVALARHHRATGASGAAWVALLVAAVALAVAMEELSWGQRILGIDSPAAFAGNVQGETNLHNFLSRRALHGLYVLVGAYGTLAHLLLGRVRFLSRPGMVELLAPPRSLALYFLPISLLYLYYDYGAPVLVRLVGSAADWGSTAGEHFMYSKDQEPVELLMAVGVLLVVLGGYRCRARWVVEVPRAANPDARPGGLGRA